MVRVQSQVEEVARATPLPRPRALRWMLIAALVLAVVAGAAFWLLRGRRTDPMAGLPVATVMRGPLLISITESGTIKSRQQEVIKCEVEGGSTILYLIPEGKRVKTGELLVELDGSKLTDLKVAQEIVVKNAEAAKIGAEENYEVAKSQARSDIAKAQLDARFAEEDLEKYKKGDYQTEQKEKLAKVSLAQERVAQARDKRDWSRKLHEAKFISQTELQLDELAYTSAELDLATARNTLSLLENFTYKRKIDELAAAIEQTKMALERVERKAKAEIVQAEAARDAKKSEYERQVGVLDKQKRMLDKIKIYAPVDGLVVYASSSDGGWRFNREPLIEGSTVRERQDLIYLPTTSSVMAEVKIHESSLEKLANDLPVNVSIDALPGRTFTGRVAKIGMLPDAGSMWMNPDIKVYNTEIHLDEGDDDLRTGMSCRAEIIVDYYPDAVYVPVQSVVRVGGKPTVFVVTPEGPKQRTVKLGLDNNRMVRILDGLVKDEKVLLSPPLTDVGGDENVGQKPPASQPATRPTTRPRDRNLTPEQREEMRKRFESMTPEQRDQMRRQSPGGGGKRSGSGDRPPGGPGGPR